MDYKKELIIMIERINNNDFIVFVYNFTKRLKENWGL